MPITQYLAGKNYVSNSGVVTSTSGNVHTSGKFQVSKYIPVVNSFLSYRGDLSATYGHIKTFRTNGSQNNGAQNYINVSLATGLEYVNYVAVMSDIDNYGVTTIMWYQPVDALSLDALSFPNGNGLTVQNDEVL